MEFFIKILKKIQNINDKAMFIEKCNKRVTFDLKEIQRIRYMYA